MEDQLNQQATVTPAPVQPVKKKRGSKVIKVMLLVLLLVGAGGGLYWQNKQLTSKKNELAKASAELDSVKGKLEAEKVNLKLATNPGDNDFSPQCVNSGKANNSDLIVGGINQTPIEGYQFYIVSCANTPSVAPKIIGFKSENGNRTFAYGASSLEPICISKDVLKITTEKAQTISKTTRVPLCKNV